jgi:hypothetical protein
MSGKGKKNENNIVNCVQVQFRQFGNSKLVFVNTTFTIECYSFLNSDYLYDFVIMNCCICEISITSRKPQIIECVSCWGFMHRQCMPVSLSSTEFVRMKKWRCSTSSASNVKEELS